MRDVLQVIRHEIRTTLAKRSFWLTTFLMPALVIGMSFGSQLIAQVAFEESEEVLPQEGEAGDTPAVGYVDRAGVIELPQQFPQDLVRAFPTEEDASEALAAGELSHYYVIPPDFMDSGQLIIVNAAFNPFQGLTRGDAFEYIIVNSLVDDPNLAALLSNPTPQVESVALSPEAEAGDGGLLAFFVPFAVMFIFFFVITMSSSFMLQSVAQEKENRTVEILLVSLRPRELMLGKIVGLGVVALLQMAIWMGGGLLVLEQRSQLLEAAAGFSLPPAFILWAVLYFLFGYLVYASALGAIGALAPNVREGSQFTFFVLLPIMIPLWISNTFFQAPNGPVTTFLSLFPLTAPTSMLTRLAATEVPLWQLLAGLAGLALTAYLFVLLSARFFRAETLLSSDSLRPGRILAGLRGEPR